MVRNLMTAMAERGVGFGFGFLNRSAGFDISESPIPYRSTDTYAKAFLVGLLNTLFVSFIGIILATILGVLVGVARLSPNWLLRRITSALRRAHAQYAAARAARAHLLRGPAPAAVGGPDAGPSGVDLPEPARRLRARTAAGGRTPGLGSSSLPWASPYSSSRAGSRRRREDDGRPIPGLRALGWLVLLVLAVIGWIVAAPMTFDLPVRERFNFIGGLSLSPEFTALLVGLVLYTAAFIGEVVRGGIQAVRQGQLEAARALGLSEGDTLRMIVFPQALRIIVPPLTSQYLNLAKNSSLAVAIGYPDLFKVGQTMANQTGQPVPVIILIMGTYLAISLATSLLMNIYNRRVQVLER